MTDSLSRELLTKSEQRMPGGVNSPVRAHRNVGGHPVFVRRARGSTLEGADGKEYIDYVGSWGPMILGHAHPEVVGAVQRAAQNGLSYGAPTELELELAELISERVPSMEMLRLVNSGTEATMSALRVARGFTKRDVIVKFDGGYHGHADCLLVQAGSGAATFGHPDSAGVPAAMVERTLSLPYNDIAALKQLFAKRGGEIAAVIVEPVAGNMGCVPPQPEFLETILEQCKEHGAVSIFDEVMTGFRLARGGAQERFGLQPDLTCLGKVVGGGMPLAVYGGRRDIMELVAPLGPVYQAGTLSGNPVAVSAGLATLRLLDASSYTLLEERGARLEAGLVDALARRRVDGCVQRVGSMITLFFQPGPVRSWKDSAAGDKELFARWFRELLAQGVHWPPSPFEAAFISIAHSEDDIDRSIDAAAVALASL